jgi:ribonucleoside-diphosphate reductase alpha chain
MINVTKRCGRKEPLDLEKIHNVIAWAAEGLEKVSISQVELKSHIQFYEGMKTADIHEIIIKSAADLISIENPDYQYLAARLAIFHLRKQAYGEFCPPRFIDHIAKLSNSGHYDSDILKDFTIEEIEELGNYIDHERDMNIAYAGIKQLIGKYLVQDRVNNVIFETPQMLYMLVGMCLYSKKYNGKRRMDYIKGFYDAASKFKISLPTPIMGGVRTPTRQFSSCVKIDSGDSLDSINASSSSIVKYISRRAGIGINVGGIRALGDPIRNGEAVHTGLIPFLKHFQTAVKSCSQGGLRGGAATAFYPIWHLEAESLLVLKNNKGVEDNRVRHLDYAVQFNKLMYRRLVEGGNITLFSPKAVKGMYEAFFADQELFEKLYTEAEGNPMINQKSVKASELFTLFAQERAGTGRIYLQNVDHCNTNSPFIPEVAPIRMSNLCLEIALPTKPLEDVNDEEGEIALCTLSAFNLGEIDDLEEMEYLSELVVRALDALLDYQDYPIKAAEISTKNRRTLGVGFINYAHYLAKNGMNYSDGSANNLTHELFEKFQFYLLKASCELAKEQGACPSFHETSYSQGVMPIHRYTEKVDTIHSEELHMPWHQLRRDILEYGLRNSTLSALMPSETSSQVSNATNGIEPPRGLMSIKASKDGILKQVVPQIETLASNYELLWDIPNNKGYIELVAIMQKFVDQTISANTNYDPAKFPNGKVPVKQILKDILTAYGLGVKTMYYHNTRDGASEGIEEEDEICESGACKI